MIPQESRKPPFVFDFRCLYLIVRHFRNCFFGSCSSFPCTRTSTDVVSCSFLLHFFLLSPCPLSCIAYLCPTFHFLIALFPRRLLPLREEPSLETRTFFLALTLASVSKDSVNNIERDSAKRSWSTIRIRLSFRGFCCQSRARRRGVLGSSVNASQPSIR